MSKLKKFWSDEKSRATFSNWWEEQKKNETAPNKLRERLEFLVTTVYEKVKIDAKTFNKFVPDIFETTALLGMGKGDEKGVKKDLFQLINDTINFYEELKVDKVEDGNFMVSALLKVSGVCAFVIPLFEEATSKPVEMEKSVQEKAKQKCSKHKSNFLVHPYTRQWLCFECYPDDKELQITQAFVRVNMMCFRSAVMVSKNPKVLCEDVNCTKCLHFRLLGFHEKRGAMQEEASNLKVTTLPQIITSLLISPINMDCNDRAFAVEHVERRTEKVELVTWLWRSSRVTLSNARTRDIKSTSPLASVVVPFTCISCSCAPSSATESSTSQNTRILTKSTPNKLPR